MASRLLLRQYALIGAAGAATGVIVTPMARLHAEAAPHEILDDPEVLRSINKRKPIYDDYSSSKPTAKRTVTPSDQSSQSPPTPSQALLREVTQDPNFVAPTDRLAKHIAASRQYVHTYAARAEDGFNGALARAFRLENSFTATIAGLAPSRQSGETVLPGAIYALVAGMGASVLAKNRNILIRAPAPLVVGIGAANYLIPVTMRNVGDLVWQYEKKFPVLADTHLRARERVQRFASTGIDHASMSKDLLEHKIGEVRQSLEGWVSKGR